MGLRVALRALCINECLTSALTCLQHVVPGVVAWQRAPDPVLLSPPVDCVPLVQNVKTCGIYESFHVSS